MMIIKYIEKEAKGEKDGRGVCKIYDQIIMHKTYKKRSESLYNRVDYSLLRRKVFIT